MKFLKKIETLTTSIENLDSPFIYFILTFIFAVALRNFLETISDPDGCILFVFFSHYYIFYSSLVLTFIVLFHFATRVEIGKTARLVFAFSPLIIMAPLFDLIISSGRGFNMAYMFPEQYNELLLRFLSFGGSFTDLGITPGIRIEVGLIILASFFYFLVKKVSLLRSLFFAFLTYLIIFMYGAAPFILTLFYGLPAKNDYFLHVSLSNLYLLIMSFLSPWIFYLHNKKFFTAILKDIRILRLMHFELMFIFGVFLAWKLSGGAIIIPSFQDIFFYVIFVLLAILYACLFSAFGNNLADRQIDRISNKARPTVSMEIPTEKYEKLSWIFFFMALFYSLVVNFTSFFLILLFIGNFFLYSMPPLRLKRIPFFSKIFISLNSLVLVIMGYLFMGGKERIPGNIVLFFLVFFTAALNLIDIKDFEGDRHAGIKTLPTILGLEKSKKLIGLLVFLAYLSIYLVCPDMNLFVFSVILGAVQFVLITRKNYNERPILLLYLLTLLTVIFYFAR